MPTLAEARALLAEEAAWRATSPLVKRSRNGATSCAVEDIPPHLRDLNPIRSQVEVADFIADPPDRYFAYVTPEAPDRPSRIVTFIGDKLGDVTCLGQPFRSNFRDERQSIRVHAINGRTYAGTYYRSAGSYCRLRQVKS